MIDLDKQYDTPKNIQSDNIANVNSTPKKSNNRLWIIIILVVAGFFLWSKYNGLVGIEENVNNAWSKVEDSYQARADKTKNLTKIVKGSSEFESKTLKDVIEARSKATSITLEGKDLTEENIKKFQEAQDNFSNSLSKLMVVVEQYPELKSVQLYQDFMSEYSGMENRINKARDDYNDVVNEYNSKVRKFPTNIVAGITGFDKKNYFKSAEGSEKAPDIEL